MSSGRTPFNYNACMGLPTQWRASDLAPSYTNPLMVLNAVSVNTTSSAINAESNSVNLLVKFSDGATSCSVTLLVDDGTGTFVVVGTRTGINALKGDLYFGSFDDNTSLKGRQVKVQISSYSGSGTVTVLLNRVN